MRYKLDTSRSRFTVQAFAEGMLWTFAYNPTIAIRDFTGEVQFAPDKLDTTSLKITVKTGSLEVTDDIYQKDRQEMENKMRQEVLETSAYPDIVFQSTSTSTSKITENWYLVQIKGTLLMHGVTNNEQINAQVRILGDSLRAYGDFTLRLSNYKIKLVSGAMGTVMVKDELKFLFDIVAQKEGE
ncbi:MAG: YceI family protein [Nitrososphaera sp.]|nr:YceI family protein [Nitrososphaera sp.]